MELLAPIKYSPKHAELRYQDKDLHYLQGIYGQKNVTLKMQKETIALFLSSFFGTFRKKIFECSMEKSRNYVWKRQLSANIGLRGLIFTLNEN